MLIYAFVIRKLAYIWNSNIMFLWLLYKKRAGDSKILKKDISLFIAVIK